MRGRGQGGARLIIINRDPTPYDQLADAVIREPIGEAVPALVEALLASRAGQDVAARARESG